MKRCMNMKKLVINYVFDGGKFIMEDLEILSIGEKIKRIRTYKGIKLKDICNESLSISKISCIENGKIIPDKTTLEFLAIKIGSTYEYLSKDVSRQILDNIESLNKDLKSDNFDKYKYNLLIAIKNNMYDLVFYICNQIFKKIVFNSEFYIDDDKILDIIPNYFDSLLENMSVENEIIYSLDLACYFFIREEYEVSSYYFGALRTRISDFEFLKPYEELIILNEINCYINLKQYYKLNDFEKIFRVEEEELKYPNEFKYFKIVLSLKYGKSNFVLDEINEFIMGISHENREFYLYKICKILHEFGFIKECIKCCGEIYKMIKCKRFEDLGKEECKYLSYISKIYIENSNLNHAIKVIEDSLNLSIQIGCNEYVCESYFNKGIFYAKKGDYDKMETYINLSIYFLMKLNLNKNFEKCLDIGFSFYKLGNIYDAIKIFKQVI